MYSEVVMLVRVRCPDNDVKPISYVLGPAILSSEGRFPSTTTRGNSHFTRLAKVGIRLVACSNA
jgi:hypothetical protein